jgi:hypothetical protein
MPMNNRLLVPRASFSPSKISGLLSNCDCSVLSSLKQNSDGTTDVTANGDPIGYIGDLSGNGNHARQTVATGSRPLAAFGNQAGKPGASFDGSNDFLTVNIPGFQSLTGVTIIQVVKTAAAAAADTNTALFWGFGNVGLSGGGYPAERCMQLVSTTSVLSGERICIYGGAGVAGRIGASSYSRAANSAQLLAFTAGSAGSAIFANGSSVSINLVSAITAATDISPAATGYTTDNDLHIGAIRSVGSLLYTPAMVLLQNIVYNRVLTASELNYLWLGLKAKWGIS